MTWRKNERKKQAPDLDDIRLDCAILAAVEYGYHMAKRGRKLAEVLDDYEALKKQQRQNGRTRLLQRAWQEFLESNQSERLKKVADQKLNSSDETKKAITSSKSPSAPGGREKVSA